MTAITLNLDTIAPITHERFYSLCQTNPELKLELTSVGKLIVMPPTGWESGQRNADIIIDLGNWNRRAKLGAIFDSSTGFVLPNGSIRSPDTSWIERSRLSTLSIDPSNFLPLAPDFVIELRSATDRLQPLQLKMAEYRDNGVRLGWLLNPKDKQVEIYRSDQNVQQLENPTSLSGEDVLPGFVLNFQSILN